MESVRSIITHNVVPMRSEPAPGAEQISQAIMGDLAIVLEESGEYALIRTQDRYEGWCLREHLRPYTESLAAHHHYDPGIEETILRVCIPAALVYGDQKLSGIDNVTKLVYGTLVKAGRRPVNGAIPTYLPDGQCGFSRASNFEDPVSVGRFDGPSLIAQALVFVGTPYLWGGTTSFGFDCSGFVQRLFTRYGILLPRDAYLQADSPLGVRIEAGEPLVAGDLVFFCDDLDRRGRGITHVGIALGDGRFIHSSGKLGVAVTPLDDPQYAREYRRAWRFKKG